jgi:hypothetical protein
MNAIPQRTISYINLARGTTNNPPKIRCGPKIERGLADSAPSRNCRAHEIAVDYGSIQNPETFGGIVIN